MLFKPAWISTVEHLNQFQDIASNTFADLVRTSRFHVPDDFPQSRRAMFFGIAHAPPTPLVMISNGVLELHNDALRFQAYPLHLIGSRVRNLKDDLAFSISANEIQSLERYLFVSPVYKQLNISFTRVHSIKEGLLRDFLVCAGGYGFGFQKMRKANENLFQALTTRFGK